MENNQLKATHKKTSQKKPHKPETYGLDLKPGFKVLIKILVLVSVSLRSQNKIRQWIFGLSWDHLFESRWIMLIGGRRL